LKGLQPGISSQQLLDTTWPPPRSVEDYNGMELRTYALDPFEKVEILLEKQVVMAITLSLNAVMTADALAKDLALDSLEPVLVKGEAGELLGQAYPERGVSFLFAAGSTKEKREVEQLVLDRIQPEPFLLRAEQNFPANYTKSLADLNVVLKISPEEPQALWLQARIAQLIGQTAQALALMDRVLAKDRSSADYFLTRGELLHLQGDYAKAAADAREAVNLAGDDALLSARAHCRLGDELALGPGHDYVKALEQHQAAMKLAQPLIQDMSADLRAAARSVLLDAHLGVAHDIAWGRWKNKPEVVGKWLARAKQIADHAETQGTARTEAQFKLAQQALWAHLGMEAPLAPDNDWAALAAQTGTALLTAEMQPGRKLIRDKQLGQALDQAMQVHFAAKQIDPALQYGAAALKHLEPFLRDAACPADLRYQIGRLYFRMGAGQILKTQDHQLAAPWYSKAVPLLEQPAPAAALADVGRQGESLVTMAVSYWTLGEHPKAVQLTTKGLEFMQLAVRDGLLEESALVVPLRNLAGMHQYLGHTDQASTLIRQAEQSQQKIRQ